MLIKFVKVQEKNEIGESHTLNKKFSLKEIFLNSTSIVSLEDDEYFTSIYPKDNNKEQKFTRIKINIGNLGEEIVVVGDSKLLMKKIGGKDVE
jgi:hypothetical protein